MRLFRRRKTDLQRFFDGLGTYRAGHRGYTKKDRYRDFRQVFSSEAGKRVLSQIIAESEGLPVVESEASDTHRISFRLGKRSLGLWIVRVLNAEPLDENINLKE